MMDSDFQPLPIFHNMYIYTDINNGNKYLKCAIMEVICSIEDGSMLHYDFLNVIPSNLIIECLLERGWTKTDKGYSFKDKTIKISTSLSVVYE